MCLYTTSINVSTKWQRSESLPAIKFHRAHNCTDIYFFCRKIEPGKMDDSEFAFGLCVCVCTAGRSWAVVASVKWIRRVNLYCSCLFSFFFRLLLSHSLSFIKLERSFFCWCCRIQSESLLLLLLLQLNGCAILQSFVSILLLINDKLNDGNENEANDWMWYATSVLMWHDMTANAHKDKKSLYIRQCYSFFMLFVFFSFWKAAKCDRMYSTVSRQWGNGNRAYMAEWSLNSPSILFHQFKWNASIITTIAAKCN